MSLTQQIRNALRETHDRIEQLPLTTAMVKGQLSRADYVRLLSQLLAVHAALEPELERRPELAGIYRPEMARAGLLRADLRAFGADEPDAPLSETVALVELVRQWATETPRALVGCLYVFEGSRMGSMILAKRLAEGFGLPSTPGHGLDYHLDRAHERPKLWQQFKAAVDGLELSETQRGEILAAATATMDAVYTVYEAVSPEPEPAAGPA
jgi:heme oxygenase